LIIISPFLFKYRRGIEQFTYELSNKLADKFDRKIIIYTWSFPSDIKWITWHKNIKIRKVPFSRYYQSFIAIFFYFIWIKFDKAEKIICNFLWHGESFIFDKKRDIMIFHNPISQIRNRYDYSIRFLSKQSTLVFDGNDSILQFQSCYPEYVNTHVINCGVDTLYFKPDKQIFESRVIRIICISAFEERKGIQYLLHALPAIEKQIKNVQLKIIGQGDYISEYYAIIKRLNIKHLVDIISPVNDTKQYLLESDIYVLLSKGEGFPLGLLEAMSCGLPCVVSKKAPFDEIMNERIGFMVERKNVESIVDAITLLQNREKRRKMGQEARKLVIADYSWDYIANKYDRLINE